MGSGAGPGVPRVPGLAIVLLALLAFLLPGCTEEPEDKEDPLFGLCLQWMQGPGHDTVTVAVNASSSPAAQVVFPAEDGELRAEYRGRSLDLYRIELESVEVTGGALELRAYAGQTDEQKAIRDYRVEGAQLHPVVRIGSEDAGREFDVALTPVSQETAPAPDALRLAWSFEGEGEAHIVGNVTYHYRVCGADL